MNKKILALLLTMVMVLGLFNGCNAEPLAPTGTNGPTTGTTAPAKKEPAIAQITVGTTAEIEIATRDEYAYDMLASGTSELPLVYQDAKGEYHPLLTTFSSEDSTTWTYTIVEGMTWSDGTPVTAEDILFTLQYADENGSANLQDQIDSDGNVTKAKYIDYQLSDDNMSISLTLATSNVRELSNMTSFRVIPMHIYEYETEISDEDKRISCGPYMFDSFDENAGTLTFVVNPYYPAVPNVAKIVYQLFDNEDVMYTALVEGDIDMCWNYSAGVSSTYQSVLDAADTVTMESIAAQNAPAVLAFNNATGPFANKDLRKAVSYALDYNAFKTYFGSIYAEVPNRGFVPASTVGYKDTEKLEANLDKAKEHLKKAGYETKNSDGYYINANGDVLAFELTVNSDKAAHAGYAELIKTNLEAFGIQVTLDAVDSMTYNAKTSNKYSDYNITHEAAIFGYTTAGMGMMNGLATIYVDGAHTVQGGCQVYDLEFQTIRNKMAAAQTIEEYCAAAGEMQDFYAEHTPLIALYWDNIMLAHSSAYKGFVVDAVFGLNNVNTWFSITK